MKKADLVNAIANEMKLEHNRAVSNTDVEALLASFTQVVTNELAQGGEVSVPGLGKFSTKQRAARTGRNPQTGEPLEIAAATLPAFTAAKALKDTVNN